MENKYFSGVKERFGFGCMRFPMIGEEVDVEQVKIMVDRFLESGFNYFDTAHGYIHGKSELALKEALTSRYPRESYFLANKLSAGYFSCQEDIRRIFNDQLNACGVEYFDFYLMHALDTRLYPHYKECHAFETALELKREGKIKHLGFSFHDNVETLKMILDEHPEVEFVQIQFNYLDFESESVQSRKLYELLESRGIPAIVMEPVRGGALVNLPYEAKAIYDAMHGGSYASYALRYVASFPNVAMILSGMSSIEQMEDNLSFMKGVKPLDEREMEAVSKVVSILTNDKVISCTGCSYCVDGCPSSIPIPSLFRLHNESVISHAKVDAETYGRCVQGRGSASMCIECGQCEGICPQKLEIRRLLKEIANEFER